MYKKNGSILTTTSRDAEVMKHVIILTFFGLSFFVKYFEKEFIVTIRLKSSIKPQFMLKLDKVIKYSIESISFVLCESKLRNK